MFTLAIILKVIILMMLTNAANIEVLEKPRNFRNYEREVG